MNIAVDGLYREYSYVEREYVQMQVACLERVFVTVYLDCESCHAASAENLYPVTVSAS